LWVFSKLDQDHGHTKAASPRQIRAYCRHLPPLPAALVITAIVVMTFRKPGSMTVLESQAMDTSQMLPPREPVRSSWRESNESPLREPSPIQAQCRHMTTKMFYPRITGRIVKMPVYPGDRVRLVNSLYSSIPVNRSEYKARLEESKTGLQV